MTRRAPRVPFSLPASMARITVDSMKKGPMRALFVSASGYRLRLRI